MDNRGLFKGARAVHLPPNLYFGPATVTNAGRSTRSSDEVALLQHRDHGVRLLFGGHDADRLVLVGIELRAGFRVDRDDLVALQRRGELAQRGVHAFQHLLGRGLRVGDRGFQAVLDRHEAVGEGLHRVLARLGDFFLGAAADVFGLGPGAQVGVGHLGVLGFQVRQALREVGGLGLGGRRGGVFRGVRSRFGAGHGLKGSDGGSETVRPDMWAMSGVFKGHLRPGTRNYQSSSGGRLALQRFQSASWRRSRLVGRPCSMPSAGSGARRRRSAWASRAATLSAVSS